MIRRAGRRAGSVAWAFANGARRRWDPARGSLRLPARTVSVGNLVAGGSGKTPLVAHLGREAIARGLATAVLSRGYGGSWEQAGGTLLPGDRPDPRRCGDEPALLAERAPGLAFGIGADRARALQELSERWGRAPDLIILDDGFQTHRLARDLDIVAVTSQGWGRAWFRDFAAALDDARLVVWTKGSRAPGGWDRVPAERRVRVRYRLEPPPAGVAGGYRVVAGIGDFSSLLRTLDAAGYDVREWSARPDHHAYSTDELVVELRRAAVKGTVLLTTGKDYVKWIACLPREMADARAAGILRVVEPELEFLEGADRWARAVWGDAAPAGATR